MFLGMARLNIRGANTLTSKSALLDIANICLLYFYVQDDLCELRLDVTLEEDADARAFERSWRTVLASRRLNASAKPTAVRYHLCWPNLDPARTRAWTQYLSARLAALPGGPPVAAEAAPVTTDWRGVRVWLAYRPHDLTTLLKKSRKTSAHSARP